MVQLLNIAGGAASAFGNIMQGFAQRQAADMNASLEEDNAGFAREAGEDRAKMILRIGEQFRSTIRNRASASGLVADTGSPLLIQEEALYESAKDALKAKYAARVEAYGHKQRASLYRSSGRQALSAGFMQAGASLLDTAGKGAYMYGKGEKSLWDTSMFKGDKPR